MCRLLRCVQLFSCFFYVMCFYFLNPYCAICTGCFMDQDLMNKDGFYIGGLQAIFYDQLMQRLDFAAVARFHVLKNEIYSNAIQHFDHCRAPLPSFFDMRWKTTKVDICKWPDASLWQTHNKHNDWTNWTKTRTTDSHSESSFSGQRID